MNARLLVLPILLSAGCIEPPDNSACGDPTTTLETTPGTWVIDLAGVYEGREMGEVVVWSPSGRDLEVTVGNDAVVGQTWLHMDGLVKVAAPQCASEATLHIFEEDWTHVGGTPLAVDITSYSEDDHAEGRFSGTFANPSSDDVVEVEGAFHVQLGSMLN